MATLAANWSPHNELSLQSDENYNLSSSATLFTSQLSMQSNRQPSPNHQHSSSSSSSHPDTLHHQQSHSQQQQQQQQHSSWTPSPMAQPFYPQFPPYFVPPNSHVPPHGYYDPTAAQQQFAQWALYQPMLFNAQQQHQFVPNDMQRNRTPSGASQRNSPQITPTIQPDFYQQPYPFPTNGANTPPLQSQNPNYYQGFHPYRRPAPPRQASSRHNQNEAAPLHPPYANHHNSGSSSSVNSVNAPTKSSSQHTTSTVQTPTQPRTRISSNNSSRPSERTTSSGHTSNINGHTESAKMPSNRPASTRSASTSSTAPTPPSQSSAAASVAPTQRRASKPSPLSQDSTVEEKAARRLSRDDSDLAYATGSLSGSSSHVTRTGGLKGRLRRALAINNASEAKATQSSAQPVSSSSKTISSRAELPQPNLASQNELSSAAKPKSKPIFNLKFNASTDNISLSSTVSSASVMIRKIGSMGKLARRSSIAGITKLFKDKERKKKNGIDDDDIGGRGSKGSAAETRLTPAVAELDRTSSGVDDLQGLSPAAQLVRQHTMKSKAQEDARLQALAAQRASLEGGSHDMPVTWDRGTAKRGASGNRPTLVTENGNHIFAEEDEDSYSGSDDEDDVTFRGHEHKLPETLTSVPEHVDDDDDEFQGDEDVTVRMGDLDLQGQQFSSEDYEDHDPSWDVSRPNHHLKPSKGILRNASSYNQERYLENTHNQVSQPRVRAHSYTGGTTGDTTGPGPLADIPSPDPDHIDGLHRTEHQRNSSDSSARLPDFSFEANTSTHLLSDAEVDSALGSLSGERSVFSNPALNSSAPVLSSISSNSTGAPLMTRATPTRRITFAATLSIYDTFAATIYDRRCEPVTCNRLTPALAQRIKEELNTYKMEEMEVHAASRIHTHFFV